MNAQDLQCSVQRAGQFQLLVQDGDHYVNGDRNPDLRAHRVATVAEEVMDAQVLLDPPEEKFDLPAKFVQSGYAQGRNLKVVAEKHQVAFGFGIEVAHPAQRPREGVAGFGMCQFADLIAAQTLGETCRQGVMACEAQVVLGAGDKESARLRDPGEASEIDIAPIHHIESRRFENQFVEPEHIVLSGRASRVACAA